MKATAIGSSARYARSASADRGGHTSPTASRTRRGIALFTQLAFVLAVAQLTQPAPVDADELGVINDIDYPIGYTRQVGGVSYSAATGQLVVNAQPWYIRFAASSATFFDSSPVPALTLTFTVDKASCTAAACNILGPGTLTDFVVTGSISAPGGNYSGTLLTGTVTEFGFDGGGAATDSFDARINISGGLLTGESGFEIGRNLGLRLTTENSTFTGSFQTNFTGERPKTIFGPLPNDPAPPASNASLGDRVFEDLNGNGIQDCTDSNGSGILGDAGDAGAECDAGIGNVGVELYEPGPDGICGTADDGSAIATTTTDTAGFYEFGQLDAGGYCIRVQQPLGLCDGADAQFTQRNQGGDDLRDSDVDPATGFTGLITLGQDQSDLSWDAGVICKARIGDRIWDDSALPDGVQGPFTTPGLPLSEPGIDGLTVNLYRCDGLNGTPGASPVQSMVTANGGLYGFDVAPGVYDIELGRPTDYLFTILMADAGTAANDSDADLNTGRTGCIIAVTSGQADDLTWDAGVIAPEPDPLPSELGDRLFEDLNRNGIQDTDEPGVDGLAFPTAVRVYENPDRDATCDSGDEVLLADKTQLIDANGNYRAIDLLAGAYCVEFDLPPAELCTFGAPRFTLRDQGDDDALDSDVDPLTGRSENIVLFEDTTDLKWDAGVYCAARIGDRFWDDSKLPDGIQGAVTDEPGIGGVTVNLYQCDAIGGTPAASPVQTTATAADGGYHFDVEPGVPYLVEFALPQSLVDQGYLITGRNLGGDDAFDSDIDATSGRTACEIATPSNTEDPTWDAGAYLPDGALGDKLFHDRNANGIQDDGEEGVDGGRVTLYANPDGGACEATAANAIADVTTANGGMYQYVNLIDGDYCLGFEPPANFCDVGQLRFSPRGAGSDAALDSDVDPLTGLTGNIALPFNAQDMTWDAGIYCGARLGDRVWEDLDRDGIQDCLDSDNDGLIGSAGDTGTECITGMAGIPVSLLHAGTDGTCNTGDETVLDSTSTDGAGFYLFDNLTPGDYCVEIERPVGYVCTVANVGTDDAADSDMPGADGSTLCQTDDPTENPISLGSDEDDRRWDAGLVLEDVPPPPPGSTQGCTPGYWRQPQHFGNWTAPYSPESPATLFGDVFADDFGGKSLLQVVWLGGGGENALGRHAVAALLNAASGDVDYPYTPAEVITLVNLALAGDANAIAAQKDEFERFNELGCPLGRAELPDDGGDGGDGGGDGSDGGDNSGVCPTPSIDGDTGDWDLAADFFANMYEAGKSDKDHLSTAYVRYADGRLHVLVLTTPGNIASASAGDAWVKVYDLGSSTQVDGGSADFAWVHDNGTLVGYEAAFDLAPGQYGEVEIHLNVNGGDTSSTGKKKSGYVPLSAVENCPAAGGGSAGNSGSSDNGGTCHSGCGHDGGGSKDKGSKDKNSKDKNSKDKDSKDKDSKDKDGDRSCGSRCK
jgi:hypothetical protein